MEGRRARAWTKRYEHKVGLRWMVWRLDGGKGIIG